MKTFAHSRAATAVLLLILCISLLCGCSSGSKPIKSTEEELTVVGTCNGYDVYFEELRYLVLSYKDIMASHYGEDIWQNESTAQQYLPELTASVMNNLTANYAVLTACQAFDIDINDEKIQESVQEMIDRTVAELGGRKEYIASLKELYLTDHLVRFTIATDICQSEMVYAMKDLDLIVDNELDFLDYAYGGGFCATYHIYVANDEGEDIEANRKKAEEARELLLDGTDIKELLGSTYNEDVYLISTPYYFTIGEYHESYEKAAFALEVGGISEVVETDDGFYVIVRQALDQNYLVLHAQELMERYEYAQVEMLVQECQKDLTVELNEYGKSLDLLTLQAP